MSERITVPADLAGERVDRVVAVMLEVSRRIARIAVDAGDVTRAGEPLPASARLAEGDEIEVRLTIDATVVAPDESVEFDIAYEDDAVAVVDKPPGVVVHPGAGRSGGTLANGLLARIPALGDLGEERRWGIVHRIDRDTSGLLLIAKTAGAFDDLQAALKQRTITRRYRTLVTGTFTNATGTIDAPVGRDPAQPTRMTVIGQGRPARTHYTRLADWDQHGLSLLAVRLETGRTHQIRVHMRAIDHPVVGDPVYGPGKPTAANPGRTWLHAASLTFDHPSGSGRVTVHADLPQDLAESLRSLGEPDRGAIPPPADGRAIVPD